MTKKNHLTILELVVLIILLLTILSMILPIGKFVTDNSTKSHALSNIRSLGLTMIVYAEDDIREFKMPYPLPRGKEKVWGNSKDCWSTSVVQLLFKRKYFNKGDEKSLVLRDHSLSKNYKPMYLDDSVDFSIKAWENQTPLDYHFYCHKDLKSYSKNKTVLIATYDNDKLQDCLWNGAGWVVFYSDKTSEFIKRKKYIEYENKNQSNPNLNLKTSDDLYNSPEIVLRKNIPESEGGPGTFGNFLGGGSTELMGKQVTDPIYKALVK